MRCEKQKFFWDLPGPGVEGITARKYRRSIKADLSMFTLVSPCIPIENIVL
jgi:hypothetical protein